MPDSRRLLRCSSPPPAPPPCAVQLKGWIETQKGHGAVPSHFAGQDTNVAVWSAYQQELRRRCKIDFGCVRRGWLPSVLL